MISWNTASENTDITVTPILNEGKQQDFECNLKNMPNDHKAQVKWKRCNSFLYMIIMPAYSRIFELQNR